MGVGFDNPLQPQAVLAHIGSYFFSALGAGAARVGVVVQHGVDNGAIAALALVQNIGESAAVFVKKSVDGGVWHIALLWWKKYRKCGEKTQKTKTLKSPKRLDKTF